MKYTGKECWEKDGDLESCAKTTDPQGHQCEIVCKYMKVGLDAIGPDPSKDDSESPGKTRGMAQSVCRRVPKNSKPLPVGTTKGACKKNIQTGKGATKGTWKLDNTEAEKAAAAAKKVTWAMRSQNYPNKLWTVLNDDSVKIVSGQKTAFRMVDGLTGDANTVSFQSVANPDYYLRHAGFVIRHNKNDGSDLFKKDATWHRRDALTGASGYDSFESVNYPGRYIAHRGYVLRVEKVKKAFQKHVHDYQEKVMRKTNCRDV
eukprot:g1735.t1